MNEIKTKTHLKGRKDKRNKTKRNTNERQNIRRGYVYACSSNTENGGGLVLVNVECTKRGSSSEKEKKLQTEKDEKERKIPWRREA